MLLKRNHGRQSIVIMVHVILKQGVNHKPNLTISEALRLVKSKLIGRRCIHYHCFAMMM